MVEMEPFKSSRVTGWIERFIIQGCRISAVLALLLVVGFGAFYYSVMRLTPNLTHPNADAIVVLTGGEERVAEAIRLLSVGSAKRLLISGVNRSTTKPELISFNGLRRRDAILFRCCIDLDREAVNTEDNAAQTTMWARERGFRSLIVVTSTYHMPRALIELRQVMPGVDLIPFPVKSKTLENRGWGKGQCFRVLGKEYLKFITAAVRYAAKSLSGEFDGDRQFVTPAVHARLG